MKTTWHRSGTFAAGTLSLLLGAAIVAHEPPARGGGAGQGGRGAGAPQAPAAPAAPAVPQVGRTPKVDPALVAKGKGIWGAECITCHGTNARGSEGGPNLIRSTVVNYDRALPTTVGTVLGPFLKKGHPMQSGRASAALTEVEVVALSNFLSERINETMRGSPLYIVLPESVLTGDAKAGEAFFNGEGTCTKCHNATSRSLAGIATRIPNPQQLQARVLYPGPAGGGRGGRGGRGAPAAPPPPEPTTPNPLAITVTITPASGPAITGWPLSEDAFLITIRDASGTIRTISKAPGMKIVATNPMQWHVDFAERLTDKQMHDLTAYLWSLK